jgi:3-oxoacyl-(acyl-carrier-protein) synthase
MKNILCMLLALGCGLSAHAAIFKHVDADGRVTYTNVPMKGAVKLDIEPSSPSSVPPATSKETPASFPKVEKFEQKQRDDKRREILELELVAERKALENAKLAYEEAEKDPEVFKTTIVGKNGKPQVVTRRNVAKYQEKLQALQSEIDQHQQNVEMLEQELSRL